MAIPFKYNRRSLLIRRVSNSMTVGAIAIVVGVFVAAMAIVRGLDSAIKDSSSPDNMILIGRRRSGPQSIFRFPGTLPLSASLHWLDLPRNRSPKPSRGFPIRPRYRRKRQTSKTYTFCRIHRPQ